MSNNFNNWNGTTIHEGQEFSEMAKNVANDNAETPEDYAANLKQQGRDFVSRMQQAQAKHRPAQVMEGFDDPKQQENSVSPVNSVSPAKPDKTPAQQYMDLMGIPGLSPEQQKRLEQIQKLSAGRDEPAEPEHIEEVKVQGIQDIQKSINQNQNTRYRDDLKSQYEQMRKMSLEYGKLGKTFNSACDKYGYSNNLSAEKKQALLDAHPELARAKERLESYGEIYKGQIYRVGRAAQKCKENDVPFNDLAEQIHKDVEHGDFDIKGQSALEKISQAIAKRISKVFGYVKKVLGFGKKDVQVQAEQTQTKPSSTPTLG